MLISCPFDGSDKDSNICLIRQRSARLQKRRPKPITNRQCLNCKAIKNKVIHHFESETLSCCICGKVVVKTNPLQKYCIDCQIERAAGNRKAKLIAQKNKNLAKKTPVCIDCGCTIYVSATTTRFPKRCPACTKIWDRQRWENNKVKRLAKKEQQGKHDS